MTRLLLVDDSEPNRITSSALLEAEGFDVEVASSFASAHATIVASTAGYDLVLLDQHLGDGLGSDLVPVVREHSARSKIVVLTGDASELPKRLQVEAVLIKGTDFDDVLTTLNRALGAGD